MNFFTSDQHYFHTNMIKYSNRPFTNVEEMNETLIRNHNRVVGKDDTIYFLGDFGFGSYEVLKRILDQLNGKKILIIGSHDKSVIQCRKEFISMQAMLNIRIENIYITLCHYCMRTWDKSHYNTWHLYGHSHGRLPPIGKSWDVGVDSNNFTPLSFEKIKEIMKGRPDNPNLVSGRGRR